MLDRLGSIIHLRLRSILRRSTVEQELDEEFRYHLEREIDENIARGMSRAEARLAALRSISGLEQRKEECRDMRRVNVIDNLIGDVRFALRQLRNNPGFTLTAVLMLAVGMCASVAIFAFVDAALLKPLPYGDTNRILMVFETHPNCPQCGLSYLDYRDWRNANQVFRSTEAYKYDSYMVGAPDGTQSANGFQVTDGFFRTLGITPMLGRDFHDGEASIGAPRSVLLSYSTWQLRYGGKSDIVGQTVLLNGNPNTIVGVLPREFHFASTTAEFWTALHPSGSCMERRNCHGLHVIARLKDDVSISAALANVKVIAEQLEKQYPASNHGWGARLVPLRDVLVEDVRSTLFSMFAGAGLLLLIAGVNVASLMLIRSESRTREMALRTALGASKGRILAQFVTEALIMSLLGSALGVVSAAWVMQILVRLIPPDMAQGWIFLADLSLNTRVLIFAGAVFLLASLVFSVTPAIRLWRPERSRVLAVRSSVNVWRGLGAKLVVVELAIAVVLLTSAGLLGKSLLELSRVDIGVQPDHLVTLQMAAPKWYATKERAIAVEQEVVAKMESLPGVTSAAIASDLPVVSYWSGSTLIRVLGRPWNGEQNTTVEREVSSAYFATLEAKLLRGRYFRRAEDVSKPDVVIVNEAFARHYFPGEDPIGKLISYDVGRPLSPIEIIGMVKDIKEGQLDSTNQPTMYVPFVHYVGTYFSVIVRSSLPEQPMVAAMTSALHEINPEIATRGGGSLTNLIDSSGSNYMHRSTAWLAGGFAAIALFLGVIGLYGVVAYSVSQRTHEIGIRMALGAGPRTVYQLVLKEAGWLASAGIVIGLACAVAAANLMRGLLFGVSPWDAPTLVGIAVVLGGAALLASFIPARRAASVNPVEALRAE